MRFWWSRPEGYNPDTYTVDEKKPIFFQVGHLGKRYDAWTHAPKQGSPIYFGNALMEMTTNTPWFLVPSIWVPVSLAMLYTAINSYGVSVVDSIARAFYGMAFWTLLEYCIHRFLFHADVTSYWTITFHFAFHGVHHKWPLDRLRLVFPPTFAAPVIYLLFSAFDSVMERGSALCMLAGGVLGYVAYDVTHYGLHHGPQEGYLKILKTKHMDHHFKDYSESYGITSAFWDLVFNTMPKNKLDSRTKVEVDNMERDVTAAAVARPEGSEGSQSGKQAAALDAAAMPVELTATTSARRRKNARE